jgi:hypothetical protein
MLQSFFCSYQFGEIVPLFPRKDRQWGFVKIQCLADSVFD